MNQLTTNTMKTLKLTALGLSGKEWIERLEKGGYKVGTYAKQLLNSPEYEKHRLKKGMEVTIAIVQNKEIGEYLTTEEVRQYAKKKGYTTPSAEVALLVREAISDEEMEELGVSYIVTGHEPIKDSDGDPLLLDAGRHGGGRWVRAGWDWPGRQWFAEGAFCFEVPQVALGTSDLGSGIGTFELGLLSLESALERVKQEGFVVYKPM